MINIYYDRDCIEFLGRKMSINTIKDFKLQNEKEIIRFNLYWSFTNHEIYDIVKSELLLNEEKNKFYIKKLNEK